MRGRGALVVAPCLLTGQHHAEALGDGVELLAVGARQQHPDRGQHHHDRTTPGAPRQDPCPLTRRVQVLVGDRPGRLTVGLVGPVVLADHRSPSRTARRVPDLHQDGAVVDQQGRLAPDQRSDTLDGVAQRARVRRTHRGDVGVGLPQRRPGPGRGEADEGRRCHGQQRDRDAGRHRQDPDDEEGAAEHAEDDRGQQPLGAGQESEPGVEQRAGWRRAARRKVQPRLIVPVTQSSQRQPESPTAGGTTRKTAVSTATPTSAGSTIDRDQRTSAAAAKIEMSSPATAKARDHRMPTDRPCRDHAESAPTPGRAARQRPASPGRPAPPAASARRGAAQQRGGGRDQQWELDRRRYGTEVTSTGVAWIGVCAPHPSSRPVDCR
jgi:hypothetical protein